MEFEWDEAKRQANIAKHGIDFYDAKAALEGDPMMLEDDRMDYGERRCIAAGEVKGHMLIVVFTIRDGVFRIISARKANSRERRKYAD
ncbi:MAG: BrnT family toxin [Solidesulfovibrio sp. DCME]|uniref:BrnT family toxin n=1 Tax=Solidesulfovibrio sp. DCME TaxID=3447380 RepID=UPI003D0C9F83